MTIGDRVTHRDLMAQDGRRLPMTGTVVGVVTTLIVQWDHAEDRSTLFGGGKETHTYPPDVLMPLSEG